MKTVPPAVGFSPFFFLNTKRMATWRCMFLFGLVLTRVLPAVQPFTFVPTTIRSPPPSSQTPRELCHLIPVVMQHLSRHVSPVLTPLTPWRQNTARLRRRPSLPPSRGPFHFWEVLGRQKWDQSLSCSSSPSLLFLRNPASQSSELQPFLPCSIISFVRLHSRLSRFS